MYTSSFEKHWPRFGDPHSTPPPDLLEVVLYALRATVIVDAAPEVLQVNPGPENATLHQLVLQLQDLQ